MLVKITQSYSSGDRETTVQEVSLVDRETYTMGRSPGCDLVLLAGDNRVSRIQATLFLQNKEWYIMDGSDRLGKSSSGIYVDNDRLRAPCKISLGKKFTVYEGTAGTVTLELTEDTIEDLYNRDTDENDYAVALRGEIAALREKINENYIGQSQLESIIRQLEKRVEELSRFEHVEERVKQLIEGELEKLKQSFHQEFINISDSNEKRGREFHQALDKITDGVSKNCESIDALRQDLSSTKLSDTQQTRDLRRIQRDLRKTKNTYKHILVASVATLLVGGIYTLTGGKSEETHKILSGIATAIGLLGGGKVAYDGLSKHTNSNEQD